MLTCTVNKVDFAGLWFCWFSEVVKKTSSISCGCCNCSVAVIIVVVFFPLFICRCLWITPDILLIALISISISLRYCDVPFSSLLCRKWLCINCGFAVIVGGVGAGLWHSVNWSLPAACLRIRYWVHLLPVNCLTCSHTVCFYTGTWGCKWGVWWHPM